MQPDKKSSSSENKNISISGDVSGIVIVGDHNTAQQTIIQKFFNIFKSDSETLERCVDLIFPRRVGGGYIFFHRLLMEHFSKTYTE